MDLNTNKETNNEFKFVKQNKSYLLAKRIIDITMSFLGIIILSPVFIIVAILIKLDDHESPVIFKQVRVGLNGKEFEMYKFRSMIRDADILKKNFIEQNERKDSPMFKIKNDPRVTQIGKFIRKTSIDELPQLINVIKGDMSLVGPRPSIPDEVIQFEPWMLKRLQVKPGLTCYWQVKGRDSIGFKEWMRLDAKYVDDKSLILDTKLIIKTIFVLIGDRNAS